MPESTEGAGGGTTKPDELRSYVFAVGEKPYCCWEWDLPEQNLQFLESLDTG